MTNSDKGKAIGSTIGAASNFLLPGLGTILSPVLGAAGGALGGEYDQEDALNTQNNQLSVNSNPYKMDFGGFLNDPVKNPKSVMKAPTYKPTPKSVIINAADNGKDITPLLDYNNLFQEANINSLADIEKQMGSIYKEVGLKEFKNGGELTGKDGAEQYSGATHDAGGIDVNAEGTPSSNPVAEVEDKEFKVNINNREYIFSNTLKI